MYSLKYFIKTVIAYSLYYSGVIAIMCKRKLQNKLVVLMYHRVLTNEEKKNSFSHDGIIVTNNTFEKHIRHISKYFTPLNIDQVVDHIGNTIPFKSGNCLITFDDGWHDNYDNALPILRSNNVPALIFLPTNFISTGNLFWQEQLANYILFLCQNSAKPPSVLNKHGLSDSFNKKDEPLRNDIYQYIGSLKKLTNQQIDAILDEFSQAIKDAGYPLPENRIDKYINWDQALEMSENDIQFGSHAMSHRLLTKLSTEELDYELARSREIVKDKLNNSVISIAYPNGNYNEQVVKATGETGYKIGFTTESGYYEIGDNPLQIKRVNMHQNATANIPLFMCRILGIF